MVLVAHMGDATERASTEIGRTTMRVRLGWAAFEWRMVLLPLYLLLLIAAMVQRGRDRQRQRLLWNRLWLRFATRIGVGVLIAAALWVIWRYSPGTLPPLIAV